MMFPEGQCLPGRKCIETKGTSAEETPVTFIIGSGDAMVKIGGNTVDFTGRQMPVSGEKSCCFYAIFRKKMIVHRVSPF